MAGLRLTVVSIVVAVVALALVVELVRRRRLREKYAAIWVLISVGTLVVALVPGLLPALSELVGVRTPSNLLFFGSLIVLFAVSLQLSREVGLLEEQTRTLAEETARLRLRVRAVEEALGQEDRLSR